MAPDLNSVPPSPHSSRHVPASSTRAPEAMAPPPPPIPVLGPNFSNQSSRESAAPVMAPSGISAGDNTGVGFGPGPIRHPRPLTAADLHMQLEKEQEAVVNRLTRELSLLRQQSVSVASTTSSTSTGLADSTDHSANHLLSGASHPTPSRRHRSSSSLSTRSANTAATTASGLTGMSGSTVGTTAGVAGSTISGITPARDVPAPYSSYTRDALSRHNSITSSRRSEASSPSLSSSLHQGDHFPNLLPHRQSSSSQHGYSQSAHIPLQTLSPSNPRPSHLPPAVGTSRYEEAAHHRSELDIVKRENESLRRRIRELERSLNNRRQSDMGRNRSDSVSTGTSIPPNSRRQTILMDDDDDAVNVGESAGSVGVGGGH